MDDFEITRATFYKEREVITPTEFSMMVRGYPSFLTTVNQTNFPELATKRGKREYYYLDEMVAWYEYYLAERARQVEVLANRFAKIQELSLIKKETNKASRQALLDSLKK